MFLFLQLAINKTIVFLDTCRLNNPDSVKKRSKLVLPKPQISDTELEEVLAYTVMLAFIFWLVKKY